MPTITDEESDSNQNSGGNHNTNGNKDLDGKQKEVVKQDSSDVKDISLQKEEGSGKLCQLCLRKYNGKTGCPTFGFKTLPNGKRIVSRMDLNHKIVL